jgi:hypothetical protein
MQPIWDGTSPSITAVSPPPVTRWRRRVIAGLATSLAALGLAAASVTVASAAPPPPAPGIAPAAVAGSSVGLNVFYTAANGTVWTQVLGGTPTQVSDGKVVAAVSGLYNGSALILFGEGADHALWTATRTGTTWSNWSSLGGNVTSKPGAVFRGPASADYSVFVRGGDGAVWGRDHSSSGWGAWHSIGGALYGGTGPSAAYFGGTYVLVAGTNKELYLAHAGVTGFSPVGGQTAVSPALTTVPGALAAFARGTDSAAYYHRFLSSSPGWHKIGGVFTTGLAAANTTVGGSTTYTLGLGTDSQAYLSTGHWTAYPPTFTGWVKVTS